MIHLKHEDFKNIYLVDQVSEEDKFDHQDFAEILWRIINDNTLEKDLTPFNIGIFGKWGVGKSTVVKLFTKILDKWNKENHTKKKYKFIEFKVWKFSKEALKRKFIFSIGKSLFGQKVLDEINTEVRGQKTISFPLLSNPGFLTDQLKRWKSNISWSLFRFWFFIFLIVDVAIVFLNYKFNLGWVKSFSDIVWLLLILLVGQTHTFLSYLFKSIKEAKISIAFDKYETDEQFEEKFIDLVEKSEDTIKIIFIDDLDRCPEDKVIEALETIKTYLDVKTCIFVIACADDVIRRVVEAKRKELCKEGDSADYLNKFFSYTIRIPPFIHQNMRDYAKRILEHQNNDLLKLGEVLDDVLEILIHNDVFNPRKAISLINNFSSDLEVVMKREESELSKLHEGEITSNLPALAVFTVIKTDYPRFYDLLIRDNQLLKYMLEVEEGRANLLEEYHKRVLTDIYFDREEKTGNKIFNPKHCGDDECERFALFVRGIAEYIRDLDNFSPFIYLDSDKSSYGLKTEQLRNLCDYVRKEQVDKVKEILNELKGLEEKKNHFEKISNILVDILRSPREKKRGLKTFFNIVYEFIPDDENFRRHIAGKVMTEFSEFKKEDNWIEEFNIEGIMFTLQYVNSTSTKEGSIEIFADTLVKTTKKDLGIKLLKAIFHYEQLVKNRNIISKITGVLYRRKVQDENKELSFFSLDEICNFIIELGEYKKEAVEKFFSGEIIDELCAKIKELDKPEKDMTAEERQKYDVVEKAFDLLDEIVLSKDKNIEKRIEVFIKLIPTSNYYLEIIKKLSNIISKIPKKLSPQLLEALSKEVHLVEGEDLEKTLSIIDQVSMKSEKPIKELNPLTSGLTKIIFEKFGSDDFNVTTNHLVKFCDGRFSDGDLDIIFEQLCTKLNIYESTELTGKICNFMLASSQILTLNAKIKFFEAFVNGIYDVKTYDKQKFPNDEGIRFWESLASKVIKLVLNKEKLITNIPLNNCLSAQVDAISLEHKSILMDIIRFEFNKYPKESQDKLIAALIPYLSVGAKEKIRWGIGQIYLVLKEVNLSELESQLKQNLLINICNAIKNIDDNQDRCKALELLKKEGKSVSSMGQSYKEILLNEIELQFDKDRNNVLAFEGFISEFDNFSEEKHISLCGKYLGSDAYSPSYSKKLIKRITEDFSTIKAIEQILPQPILEETKKTNDVNADSTQTEEPPDKKIEFIERYIIGINLDERAWTFFAELFTSLVSHLGITSKRKLGQDCIKIIKTKEEASNISRNRFSIINILKSGNAFNESDVHGLFTHLFTSEDRVKVELACDFFSLYYKDTKMMRDHKKSYNLVIEESIKKFENDPLRDRLIQIKS
mgnify:CR=1 FL=1